MSGVVDMTVDSEDDDLLEVVDVITDGEDEAEEDARIKVKVGGPPVRFHGYRRGRELGRGASGQVYVCHKKGATGYFAVKAVDLRRIQLSSNAEREHKSLCREVDILKRLPPHPSIVQLIDAFEEGDAWLLLVLELVGGGDLYTALTTREPPRFQDREAAYVLRQLADGLAFLHGQGVIHRDLKLENVLVASEFRERFCVLYTVKITDFGLSKAIGAGLSEACSLVGTRPYTAPEVLDGASYDFSSDLWCLGVLLYVLLCGQYPFDRMAANQEELDAVLRRFVGSKASLEIVTGLLMLDAGTRISLQEVLDHAWTQEHGGLCSLSVDLEEEPPPQAKRRKQGTASPALAPVKPTESSLFGSLDATEKVKVLNVRAVSSAHFNAMDAGPILLPASAAEAAADAAFAAALAMEVKAEEPAAPQEPKAEPKAEPAAAAAVVVPPLLRPTVVAGGAPPAAAGAAAADSRPTGSAWPLDPSEVDPPAPKPDFMQVHIAVPDCLAGAILGRNGVQMKQIAATLGCKVRMTGVDAAPGPAKGARGHRIVIVGNYSQCVIVQELIHGRLSDALRAQGKEPVDEVEAVLLVRAEAAGVVIGKQGFVLRQIRKQSGARIQLLREEIKGQRPCLLAGSLQHILRAERHVFDLVRAVPVPAQGHRVGGPDLPRTRISEAPVSGKVVSWKGLVGWIQPDTPIQHPQATAHHGHIYTHEKDVMSGGSLLPGQRVAFHVYEDRSGLGAEECYPV